MIDLDGITPFILSLDLDPSAPDSETTLQVYYCYVLTSEEAIARAARKLLTEHAASCAIYIRKEGERIADLQANWSGDVVECERWDGCDSHVACMSYRMLDDKLIRIPPVFQI